MQCKDFIHYMQERREYRDGEEAFLRQLYHQFFDGCIPTSSPQIHAVGGSPGAGKTTFRKRQWPHSHTFIHDMDEVLILLPEYQCDVSMHGALFAFEKWWPAAQQLANEMVYFALSQQLSMIYDRTCGSKNSYFDLLQAKRKGYTIHFVGLYVDRDTALRRIRQRQDETGRALTEGVLDEYRQRFSALWPSYVALANESLLYDHTTTETTLIFSSHKGIIDPLLYEQFLEEGTPYQ